MKRFLFLLLYPLGYLLALPGLQYTHVEVPTFSYFSFLTGHQSIHIVDIDPDLYEIKPMKALDNGIGRESVFSMAERHGAVAAINGGFFSIGGKLDGKACGALKIEDWYALPFKPRGCIGWSVRHQNPKMDRLQAHAFLQSDSQFTPLSGLNRVRKQGEAILFTPCFHKTTLTPPDGEELVIVEGRVQAIVEGGSTPIPSHGYVVSIQATHPLFHSFVVGQPLSASIQIKPFLAPSSSQDWEGFDYIVGGTPLLLHPQSQAVDFEAEQTLSTFLSWRHARTAVGTLPNGHWIWVVVDKTGIFDGMTMDELAHFMEKLGCIQALNLDGGGSSTLVYEGAIKNSPHGDEEEGAGQNVVRRVSDAILIWPKSL